MLTVWLLGVLAVPAWTVKASDAGLTSICTDVAVPEMVIVKLAVAVFPQGTVANSVKVDAPAGAGVPPIECVPSEFICMLSPTGSAPLFTVNDGWGEKG